MAVTFSGFSGLQMSSYTDTLLVGSQTWACSMFVRVPMDMGTDDAIQNTAILFGLDQDLTPYTYLNQFGNPVTVNASYQDVFFSGFLPTGDSSTVYFYAGVHGGGEFADSAVVITRNAPHHVVWGPDPIKKCVQIYLDGESIKDGVNGAFINQAWPNGAMTQLRINNTPYAIRLGNIGPLGSVNDPQDYGATTFSVEDVAIWSDYFPSNAEVIQVKDRRVTPDQVGPSGALKIWWSMSNTSGTPADGDDNLKNRINPGTFDLVTV